MLLYGITIWPHLRLSDSNYQLLILTLAKSKSPRPRLQSRKRFKLNSWSLNESWANKVDRVFGIPNIYININRKTNAD